MEDTWRTVRDATIGSQFWYKTVFAHVKGCNLCDPEEVAKAYLARREANHNGDVTQQLAMYIFRYEKLARERGSHFSSEIRKQTLIQCVDLNFITKHERDMSHNSLFLAAKRHVKRITGNVPNAANLLRTQAHQRRGTRLGELLEVFYVLEDLNVEYLDEKTFEDARRVVQVHTA